MPDLTLIKEYGPWALGFVAFFWVLYQCRKDAHKREDRVIDALDRSTQAMTILSERLR